MKMKLGEAFDLQMGKTPARNDKTCWGMGHKWISISDIGNAGKYIDATKEEITDAGVSKSGIKVVPKGTVIMSFKLSIGKTAITAEDMYTNEAIMAFINKGKYEIDTNYLYHMCKGIDWFEGTSKAVLGLTLNKATMSEKEIEIPSLVEQLEAVAVLDKMDELIALRKEQVVKLDQLVKSRFVELFGDPVQNPMEWETVLLKSATSKIGSGATPKGGKESYQTEGITLIRSMNVHDGRFEYKDLAHITDEQAKQLENVTVEENDVFINITGASVARSCIVPKHILPARVNQHVAIIRCITLMLNPVFANQMFLNTSFKGQLLDIGESGGATRQAITKQQLETLMVILPPLELQKQFATFVEQTDKSKFEIQKSLEKLETLKKALMQKYFG